MKESHSIIVPDKKMKDFLLKNEEFYGFMNLKIE